MKDLKLKEDEIIALYEMILEGKSLEDISKELNISLDILTDWKKENYLDIENQIKKIKEEGKERRLKDQDVLDQIENDLSRIEIHRVKK